MTAAHYLGPWDYHPAQWGNEGAAFVIYPATTSEPLAEVLARDGAEEIARRMALAPQAIALLERYVALDIESDRLRGAANLQESGVHREAVELLKAVGAPVEGIGAGAAYV